MTSSLDKNHDSSLASHHQLPRWSQALARVIPTVGSEYNTTDFRKDAIAGLVVASLAIPQVLGYALVAGVPLQVSLYTLPATLLAYAIIGSSRVLFVGPVSVVSVLSGSVVRQLSGGDPDRAVALTAAVAVAAGVVLIIAGLFRLGWVAQFISEPIINGFVAGLMILIITGEIPTLLGINSPHGGPMWERWSHIITHLPEANLTTLVVGLISLAVLFGGSAWRRQIPWALLVVVGSIALSKFLHLSERVAVVGTVPAGLPLPHLPAISLSDLTAILIGGAAIASVGLAEHLAAARIFARDGDAPVNTDRELIANGGADIASGLMGGMSAAGSLAKTAANARMGARSQVSGLSAAVVVVTVLLAAAGSLASLPKAVLSAIVINAVWGLARPRTFMRYARIRRNDAVSAGVACAGVLIFGPLHGILIAVAQAILGLAYRSQHAVVQVMGKVKGEKAAWADISRDDDRTPVPGIVVLRPDLPIFWANAQAVIDKALAEVVAHPDTHTVVFDLGTSPQFDVTSLQHLERFTTVLHELGIDLSLVRVLPGTKKVLQASGFLRTVGPENTWHSIAAAVQAANDSHVRPDEVPAVESITLPGSDKTANNATRPTS